jgi:hypothetical protein
MFPPRVLLTFSLSLGKPKRMRLLLPANLSPLWQHSHHPVYSPPLNSRSEQRRAARLLPLDNSPRSGQRKNTSPVDSGTPSTMALPTVINPPRNLQRHLLLAPARPFSCVHRTVRKTILGNPPPPCDSTITPLLSALIPQGRRHLLPS